MDQRDQGRGSLAMWVCRCALLPGHVIATYQPVKHLPVGCTRKKQAMTRDALNVPRWPHGLSSNLRLVRKLFGLVRISRSAEENPRWGCLHIVGELRKLGVILSATSVRNVLRRHRLKRAPRR